MVNFILEDIFFIKYPVEGVDYFSEDTPVEYSKTGIVASTDLGEATKRIEDYYGDELKRITCLEYLSDSNITEIKDEYKSHINDLFDVI